ncbi:MAG: 5-deoxy-glucuronate isomerase, partial [Candidatus Aureabacteria bacterium]|nr:5-deoxy-glucuronate isomerase [Candidatus Auribacterota bacterium]
MSSHIKKQKTIFGQNQYFSPGRPGTYNPGFSLLRLKRTTTTLETKKTELFILLLEGEITIALDESPETYTFKRSSIFKDLPSGLYVPPGKKVTIQSLRELSEAALCFSSELQRGTNDGNALQPMACRSGDVVVRDVGQGSYRRKVMTTCGAKGETRTLLVGETLSEGGMWSSYPPHRHEKNELPMENKLKEI